MATDRSDPTNVEVSSKLLQRVQFLERCLQKAKADVEEKAAELELAHR